MPIYLYRSLEIISLAATAALFLTQSCDAPPDLNPPGDGLGGQIVFIDTNLITYGGYYAISVYNADSTYPFHRVPYRSDSLQLIRRDYVYDAFYDMSGIGPGNYYVASTWFHYPKIPNERPIVLATYGCDTSNTCNNHIKIHYPNFEGVYRNIISWTDTAKGRN